MATIESSQSLSLESLTNLANLVDYYGCHQEGPVEAPDLPLGEFWVGELHLSKTADGSNRKTRGEKRGPIARYTFTGDWNLGRPNLMSIQRATNYIEEN